MPGKSNNMDITAKALNSTHPNPTPTDNVVNEQEVHKVCDLKDDNNLDDNSSHLKTTESSSNIENKSKSSNISNDKKTQEVGYDDDRYEEGYEEEFDEMEGGEQDDQGNYEEYTDFIEEDEEGNPQQFYYEDGGVEYYEEEGGYEEEENTTKELVKGPNGRLQYVIKGADGRIKCIIDAPPGTQILEEEDDVENYEHYEGEEGDFVEDEGQYYERIEDEEFMDEKGEYGDDIIQQYQHFNAENQKQYTEDGKADLMRQYPQNYDYMDEVDEYYENDECADGLTQEVMEHFSGQRSLPSQIQTPQHMEYEQQKKDLIDNKEENKKDYCNGKKTSTVQSDSSKRSENLNKKVDTNFKNNKAILPNQKSSDTKETNKTLQMPWSTADATKLNNLTKKQDELNLQKVEGCVQNLKHTSQYHQYQVQCGSQQMSEEFYHEDEEEFYDEEEEGEEFSDDEEVEAFIQKAIQKKQEEEMKQRAQYGQSQNINATVKSIPVCQQKINQGDNQHICEKLPHTKSKMTEVSEKKKVSVTSSPSVHSITSNHEGTTSIYSIIKGNFLNNLSTNNLKFKDGEGPIQNMVYLIRSNQRKDFYAMWDGENFVETPMKVSQALPSEALDSKIVGGGAKGKIKGQLKGNATGLHMSKEEEEEPVSNSKPVPRSASMVNLVNNRRVSPTPMISEGDVLPNGRKWLHTSSTNTLTRRPLHSESVNEKMCDTSCRKEQYNSGNTLSIKRSYDNVDKYVACKSCGYSSSDLEKCERCSRKFPPDMKVHSLKLKNDVSNFIMDRKSFYGPKLNEQLQPYKYARLSDQRQANSVEGSQFDRGNSPATYGQRSRSHGKKRSYLHNVKITISSDEEDSNSNDTGSQGLPVQSPQDTNVNNINTSDSQFFPGIDQMKPNRVISGSIRDRMEDQNGKVKSIKKPKKPMGLPEDLQPKIASTVSLNVRSVRIGSLKSKPLDPIIMSDKGFSCYVMCERKGSLKCRLMIEADDIVSCQGHLSPPIVVMFLLLNTAGGCKLRETLKMKPNQRAYFDPDGEDKKHKFCVLIFDTLGDSKSVKQIMYQYQIANNGGPNFYTELTHEEANLLLLQTTPLTRAMQAQVGLTIAKEVTTPATVCVQKIFDPTEEEQLEDEYHNFENAEYQEDSRSPSPPRVTFTGQLEKLLTYPPPPAKGSLTITNEDLFCLNEGEFLNDVIIDFYLKYLFLEKLSEKDRQRTHVFSSFFYKRLTHKVPKITESSTEVNKQPQDKRHSRVKTWTRHVDLFDKDFIIVPINEHSHWFLAIICYPGLEEPQFCPFLPVPLVKASFKSQSKSQSSNDETSQDDANTPSPSEAGNELSQESEKTCSKIITGIPLDPEKCIEESDNREYCLGRRQPCILIFDSLAGPSRAAVCRVLKEYLQVEWNIKRGTERNFKDFRGSSPRIPQQNNYSDCGIYVLQYVESFFQSPIMDFSIPMKGLEHWFLSEVVERKREDIKNLVLSLQRLYPRSDKKS